MPWPLWGRRKRKNRIGNCRYVNCLNSFQLPRGEIIPNGNVINSLEEIVQVLRLGAIKVLRQGLLLRANAMPCRDGPRIKKGWTVAKTEDLHN